jgi:hypothetical protein
VLTRPRLRELLGALEARLERPARLFLVGESALVAAGLQEWTDRLVYTADAEEPAKFERAIREVAAGAGIELECESPADVLPLPSAFEERARAADDWRTPWPAPSTPRLEVFHFDPVSVAFRLIARGDEPDYQAVLAFLRSGWVSMDELDHWLAEVLPRFSVDRLRQDPAEFRRKFKGLRQMWRALPGRSPDRVP